MAPDSTCYPSTMLAIVKHGLVSLVRKSIQSGENPVRVHIGISPSRRAFHQGTTVAYRMDDM